MTPDVQIQAHAPISQHFRERNVHTFAQACDYVRKLPYKRNVNKNDITCVLIEKCGTCSTKHALLYQLALENQAPNMKLMLGIFKMSKVNTPQIAKTLAKYDLTYIPEAHNYLSFNEQIIDCTKMGFGVANFEADLIVEIAIEAHQITDFKVDYHQKICKKWLSENPEIALSFAELWAVREQCIEDLAQDECVA